jgi:hypothetical protein
MQRQVMALLVATAFAASTGGAACTGDDVTFTSTPDASAADATTSDPRDARDQGNEPDGGCVVFDAALDDAEVARGLALVKQLKCQQCHGQVLSGNSNGVPSPFGGLAYPPNLTSDPGTGTGCWTNAEIANALLHGVDDQGAALCAPMPQFAEAGIDDASAAAIVAFVRSLAPVVNQVPQTRCSANDDGGLDAGDSGAPTDAADAADVQSGDASLATDAADGGDSGDKSDSGDASAPTDASDDVASDAGDAD